MELLKNDWRFILYQSDSYIAGQSWRLLSIIAFESKMGPIKYIVISRLSSTYLDFHDTSIIADTSGKLKWGMPP